MSKPVEVLEDDRHDPIAQALREQAASARMKPRAALRERTLDALRSPPAALPLRRKRMHDWRFLLAAAAMIVLAVTVSWMLNPLRGGTGNPTGHQLANGGPNAQVPGPAPIGTTRSRFVALTSSGTARLASFSRPLEREAEALQNDLKRLSNRVRNALPKREPQPATKPQPNGA